MITEAGGERAVPAAFDITWFQSELSVFLTLPHILKVYTLFVKIMLPLSEIIPSCSEEMLPKSEETLPCSEEMPVYHLTCQVNVAAKQER